MEPGGYKLRIFASLAMMMLSLAIAQQPKTVTRLAEVRRIFVDSLGDAPGADELRFKLQNRLSKAGIVTVSPRQLRQM